MSEEVVATGVLQGGWAYIITAYVITWVFLGGYGISLWVRAADARSKT